MIRHTLTAVALLTAVSAHAQMTLPGKFEVTDTGSASYTIPISVVPGTAGLEPKLSLQYDSRSGNGLLGVGWSLAGLPAITRCGRTIAQDGQVGGVAYDANDRFCLDGQRLIAISGTYGADQTEYRTERESFSKVISYGTAGSGPSWFKVWTKAGLIMEFGNTADSKIEAQGKSSIRVWALNKTSDTKSNYFTVSYIEDNTNGEYRPDRIDYTGNAAANIQPTNSVRFVYETRPDIVPMYQAGSLIKTTKRMTKVQAWQGGNIVREYQVAYQTHTPPSKSRAVAVQVCDQTLQCQGSVNMVSPTGGTPFISPPQHVLQYFGTSGTAGGWANNSDWPRQLADVNGDGLADIVGFYDDGVRVSLATGSGFSAQQLWIGWYGKTGAAGGWSNTNPYPRYAVDVNGDGLADVVGFYDDGVYVSLSTGSGFTTQQRWVQWYGRTGSAGGWADSVIWPRYLADVNGDGLADVVGFYDDGVHVSLSTGSGFTTQQRWVQWFGKTGAAGGWASDAFWPRQLADVNGDGLTDIVGFYDDGVHVSLSTGSGFTPYQLWIGWYGKTGAAGGWASSDPYARHTADVNGDGLADIVGFYDDGVYVSLSTGSGFTAQQRWIPWYGRTGAAGGWASDASWPRHLADMNRDGLADVVGFYDDGVYVSLSSGNSFLTQQQWLPWYGRNGSAGGWSSIHWLRMLADVNGDGVTDIIGFANDGMHTAIGTTPADQIGTISTTALSTTSLTYAPLSKSVPLYARDAGLSACVYPCVDVQGPLYVVSEVKSSTGLGGEYRSTYRYAGAKADQHGRGFLGFRQMTVRDEQTGVEQVTTYRQDYPFTGLVASREKTLGTQLLNRSNNSYAATDLGGTRRYPFLTQSLEESWELTGAALPAVTTAYKYDAYGNATQVGVSTGDGHSKVTNNTYSNDATNWLLGRLTRSEVTSTTPGN
jgi:hypothetical protein